MELLREQEAGGASWLEFCEGRGIYQFLNREFLDELAAQLRRVATGEVLEIAAGRGDLSAALNARGLPVRATDAGIWPELLNGGDVERLDAAAALKRYRPATVLLSWPPIDARIYQAIWSEPSVRNIVTIDPCSDWLAALPAQWQA